jgi:hypothetical protein
MREGPAMPAGRASGILLKLDLLPALHHEAHPLHPGDALERIAGHRRDIRQLPLQGSAYKE